ncbi:hypothetical protein PGB90_002177 [Kerria lacca]
MDKAARDNKSNQCNRNHERTGPGRDAGFKGNQKEADNHANQKNPNNPEYKGK